MEENLEKTTQSEMGHEPNGGVTKAPVALREEEILKFWKKEKIFEKTEAKKPRSGFLGLGKKEFVFYDGPPFATGLPHYGHLLAGTIKDVIPRFETMRGKRVMRRWGWDCHGLPLENLIEKELGLKTKKDIEILGVEKFNEAARNAVLRYADDWRRIIPRMGRFVDMENDYKTMDSSYSETIWWIFKNLSDKKLIEKGFKSMLICPRCETTLSNFEVNQGYKDVTDISVYVKFELANEPGTFLLAWTTTPWTLPGNVALAINPEILYWKIRLNGEILIASADSIIRSKVFQTNPSYEVVEKSISGEKLVGKEYKPLFDYYANNPKLENKQNGWKVYAADFVTNVDGTGIVHTAPAFGSDDYALLKKEKLPFVQHVGMDGKFKKEVTDFAGQKVKPIEDPQKADVEIIKNLAHRGLLFAKEKIVHSYPHCWRCETPLLNYATSSWFVKVSSFRDKLVAANKKVNWVPEDLRDGRFGKWLEGANDWAISRSRYWGAPIPVWECDKCEKREVLGSIEDLKKKTSRGNKYFFMRHGEGEQNLKGLVSCRPEDPYHLTEKGRGQAEKSAEKLFGKKIDFIFVSDLVRTKETAEIVRSHLGVSSDRMMIEPRLREFNIGIYQGRTWAEYHADFPFRKRFVEAPEGGETLAQVKNRQMEFLFELDSKYEGKNILFVGHDAPLTYLIGGTQGMTLEKLEQFHSDKESYFEPGEVREIPFAKFPHSRNYELDFHRPYIDEIKFKCECGGEMKRVPEVFDCWFESGAMPYAEWHYPFENLDKFNPEKGIGFPADFIAEGLDQTRGWFYSLIVLGVALFGKSPYKNVVVNGLVLAEDGKKMSKRLNNYPDPLDMVDKYGADALRFFLLSSPVTHAEDLRFSEKGVDEVSKKIIQRLGNVVSFYELYAHDLKSKISNLKSTHVLDQWIIARLNETALSVTKSLESYELDRACRPILDFIDDLSTWYLRRSRDRFKGEDEADKNVALGTTRHVLFELSKLIAPFMPFLAEDIYGRVGGEKESVHLEEWAKVGKIDERLIDVMKEIRKIVSAALEIRAKTKISVRQPLSSLRIKSQEFTTEFLGLIKDEVNVEEIVVDTKIPDTVQLDTKITSELQEKGVLRNLIRAIQDTRKAGHLKLNQKVDLLISAPEQTLEFFLIKKFESEIKKTCSVRDILLTKVEKGAGITITYKHI